MAFEGRDRNTIRDQLLAYLLAEYAAATPPRALLTSRGSDAWLDASALAAILEGLEAQAEQNARDILPDQASDEALSRHAYVLGVDRRSGAAAALTAQVTGAATVTTYAIPAGTQLTWTDGTLYDVLDTSVTTDAFFHASISIRATTKGSSTTRAVADVLTFQTAPTGLNATAPVTVVGTVGEEEEDTASWAQRIIDRLRERPASGNRADWRAWVESYTGTSIAEVYVYSLLEPPASTPGNGTPNIPGCVTVVAVGPAQGDSTVETRIVPANDASVRVAGGPLLRLVDFIEGDRDANGNLTAQGTQLRPASMVYGDYTIESINKQAQNIQATLTVTPANAFSFPFASAPGVDGSSTATQVIVSGNYSSSGALNLSGLSVLVYIGTVNYRGGYYRTTLGTGTYDGGSGLTTFPVTALPHAPVTPSFVYPATPCWDAVRAAALDYFDSLGPSDSSPPSRWPPEDAAGRSTLYLSALAGRFTQSDGVLAANVTTPAVDTTPSTWKTVLTLGTFLVRAP